LAETVGNGSVSGTSISPAQHRAASFEGMVIEEKGVVGVSTISI